MRALQLDFADPKMPVSLVDAADPDLPTDEWARVQVTVGGICGSDLHIVAPAGGGGGPSITASFVGFPMQMGHEIAGVVIEAGPACGVAPGTRVAVDPGIGCVARGLAPCSSCASGLHSLCENIGSRVITPGMALGFTKGLGAGWSEQAVAHASMLHALPDGVDDRGASLHEPLSIAVHGFLRARAPEGPVLVIGAGVIGLAAVAACRALYPDVPVSVVARYPHQASAAAAIGATTVLSGDGGFEELAAGIDAKVLTTAAGPVLFGGYPMVVDAVGSAATLTDALRAAAARGTVLSLGATGRVDVDLTPVFLREVALVGSFGAAVDPGPHGGQSAHSIDRALALLAAGAFPSSTIVTHEFALDDYRDAIAAGLDRSAGAIKVVFRPQG